MTRLSKTIFANIIFVSGIVLVAMLVCVTAVMYRYYSQQYVNNLISETYCISTALNTGDEAYLTALDSKHRITLILKDGSVVYDNERDISSMENHLDRQEVIDALEKGRGVSERYSTTLSEKTVNVAVLLSDGSILRVSDVQNTVVSLLLASLMPLLGIFILAVVLAMVLAARVSKAITAPINNIDLESPKSSSVYVEVAPLVERISAQNKQIQRQLQDLKSEHEKQDSMRRDFTANVSHELKTPLTSISGYAEIIRDGIAKPEDIPSFAGRIYDESQRLITLVGDIIKLSRLEASDYAALKTEEIDLYELCEGVISHLELAAQEKNITFSLKGAHLKIHAVEQIAEEIVFNLCDNAVKYNRLNGTVDVSLFQCVDGIELTVADSGIGISAENLEHVFERFYRVDKSHSKEIGGTGLGLSIVKHGAKFLGATISIESREGEGTTVRVLF